MGAVALASARARRELIRAELERAGGVRTRDMVTRLGVSRTTARRDLDALVDAGHAVYARGGAVLAVHRAHDQATLEREAIADAAAASISAQELTDLGLFGGQLIQLLALRLTERSSLHVVTNSLAVASVLSEHRQARQSRSQDNPPERDRTGPQVTLLGGALGPAGTVLGGLTNETLSALRLDAVYFDCAGFDPRVGATVDDPCEAELRRLAAAVSQRCVLLVERPQHGRLALSGFASPRELDTVIRAQAADPWTYPSTGSGSRPGSNTFSSGY